MKLKTQIVLTTHLVLIIASLLFGFFTYTAARRVFTNELDARLLAAATLARETLDDHRPHALQGSGAAETPMFGDSDANWRRLAETLGVNHLWTAKRVEGSFVLTGGVGRRGHSGDKGLPSILSNPECLIEVDAALENMKPRHVYAVVDGRRTRLALLPFWANGVDHVAVSGMDTSGMQGVDREVISTVAIFCLLAMLVAMLVAFYLVRVISRPVEQLAPGRGVDKARATHSGADEIRMLAENINKMSEAINTTMEQCREVEKNLRASEHKYRFLTEHTTDVTWSLDAGLRFDYISPSDEKFRGYSSEEVIGQLVWDAVESSDVARYREDPEFFAAEWEQIRQGRSRTYELRLLRKDGDPLLAEVTVTAYIDAAGAIQGYHGKVHDIRERRRLEEERSKVERLQSIGTLAGGIAHDFNNILMGLFGNIELAKDLMDPASHAYALLQETGHSMSRAVRLTKQLLVFSKGGDPQKDNDVDLASLAKDVTEFDLSGSNVRLAFKKEGGPFETAVDNSQIEQVISNIVINARQAMVNGGTLYLNITRVAFGAGEHSQLEAGSYIRLSFQDEGPGMSPAIQKRIFDPYFTTKQMGNGLGLATAYSIVEKHGGLLEVHSQEGRGAEFTCHLPVVCELEPENSAEADETDIACTNPERVAGGVLVMDDDVLICTLLKKILSAEGVLVETVPNARGARRIYKQAFEAGHPFACVILDLTISGGPGGEEVVHQLREIDPDLFAIASSGYVESMVMSSCRDHGFDTVIAKPYSRTEVLTLFKRIGVIEPD